MKTVRVFYEKIGRVKYISHLDTVRCMDRVLRKSKLPVWYTEGFNPHIYTTFANPLSLGHESLCEILEFRLLDDEMSMDAVKQRLNQVLPDGFHVSLAGEAVRPTTEIGASNYTVTLEMDKQNADKLTSFLNQEQIITLKKSKKGMKEVDIRPMLLQFDLQEKAEGLVELSLCLSAGQTGNLNPALLLGAFQEQKQADFLVVQYLRTQLLDKDLKIFA